MFYVDSQRTVTRRDSSLVVHKRHGQDVDFDTWSSFQAQSYAPFTSDSTTSIALRPKGSVQKELITMMFEAMLDSIIETWEVIQTPKAEDSYPTIEFGKTASDLTFTKRKKNVATASKISKTKRSRSRLELVDNVQLDSSQICWWSAPDEKAIIRFRNGNQYEGNISMKCMNGEGRFQWADGTVYLGQFKDNEIIGKGLIHWKDDTWYEGEFAGNLRHGKGLYADSRKQRFYAGGWYCGTKHGDGVIYYTRGFKNSYDGQWIYNERYGYGSREYCELSGYKGEWDRNVREGKGMMIWPNHDFYRGEWKNGVMSGYGIYIWDAYYNNTMALPSLNAFRGTWFKGQRNGYGVLNLGLGLGSHYKGEFKNNLKHGQGKLVTNNGLILQHKKLFIEDNLGSLRNSDEIKLPEDSKYLAAEQYKFDICDNTVGLTYHIEQALKNMDKSAEIITNTINEFMVNNKFFDKHNSIISRKDEHTEDHPFTSTGPEHLHNLITFEEICLRHALRCYETDLTNIYYKYATICNTEEIGFTPIMTRLFMWQLYYDCNVHEKGLTLVEIDNIFYQNPAWSVKNAHNPFEKIYFWQLLNSLISVASRLYAKRELPGTRPDTILSNAFRTFMDCDVLPGSSRQRGRLVNGYGKFIPLRAIYKLYLSLGEPHTVRTFLCAVRRPPHYTDHRQPALIELPDTYLPLGRNAYIFGDEMTFVIDDNELPESMEESEALAGLKLFNFGNLSSKTIIKIFAKIFPQLYDYGKIINLDVQITFFEFFEAFVTCADESLNVKEEELKWREKFYTMQDTGINNVSTPTGHGTKSK